MVQHNHNVALARAFEHTKFVLPRVRDFEEPVAFSEVIVLNFWFFFGFLMYYAHSSTVRVSEKFSKVCVERNLNPE